MRLKKIWMIFLLFTGIFILTACGELGEEEKDDGTINIVTSFYPVYISTINITKGIDGILVNNMTPPQTGCLHDYQLSTKDMKKIEKAEVVVINGAGMEPFMNKVLKERSHIKVIEASKGIKLLSSDEEVNPHVWVSVSGAIEQVKNISKSLIELDPAHQAQYEKNTAEYILELEALKTKMHKELKTVKNTEIITFHEAFPYFAEEFDLEVVGVVERDPGTEPSAGEIAKIIELVKQTGVKALFAEPQYDSKAANAIAEETGARVYTLDPVVAKEANGDLDVYIETMKKNLEILKEALSQ